MDRDGFGSFEMLVVALGALGLLLLSCAWAGASIAVLVTGGHHLPAFSDAGPAITRLAGHASAPRTAWPTRSSADIPGPVVYWISTGCTAAAAVGLGALIAMHLRQSRVGTVSRSPLGVDARAAFAKKRDLRPVLIDKPTPGRFVIGTFGRKLVATEVADPSGSKRRRRHAGDRGAVALVGPSRCGKTTAAVAGILEWEGPAILSSVKSDLLATTIERRRNQGEVSVYDPTGSTGEASGRWSPLQGAGTLLGAQRAARALCDAAPRNGVDGGLDFWLAQTEILLAGLLYAAHHARRDMGAVCRWVLEQDTDGDKGQVEVVQALHRALMAEDLDQACEAKDVERLLRAVWAMDSRTKSSVYATAQTVVWPWANAQVAASSRSEGSVSLDWLLDGSNTVYLCAPIEDQRRLAPAFGGLLNDLIGQVYRRVAATGGPLDPPLLVVIDEAGNTPLKALPEYASTLAGLGVLLVTIWQSIAQIESAYDRQADTILTNHLSKVFYAGLSDPASLRYVAQVLGDAEVETRSASVGEVGSSRSSQRSSVSAPFAPPHALRQMRPGDALLIHGTLPPAHIESRRSR